MELENVSAVVRPRGHWEAIDLGLRLVRPHYARMLWTSLLATAPLFALIHLVLWKDISWAPLALWWLKPIWERMHLHVLSRSLFGETPSIEETLRAFKSYGFRDWLPWLTIRRLSPSRSLDLPVTQLEALSGKERRRRIGLLHRGSTSTGGIWLTVVCAHVEGFIYLAFVLMFAFMLPEDSDAGLLWVASESGWNGVLLNATIHAVTLLVAPFYVGGGFGLYINRRTILEGWDLEIAFRRIAARVGALRPGAGLAMRALGLAFLTLAVATGAAEVRADPPLQASSQPESGAPLRTVPLDPESARVAIVRVLDADVFHQKQLTQVPRFLLDWGMAEEEEEEETPEWQLAMLRAIETIVAWVAATGEVILIALLLALVAYGVYRYRKEPWGERQRRRARVPLPGVLLGFDLSRESLPDDVVREVLELVRRGAVREALALLYRATLSEFAHYHDVAFGAGYTEVDCLLAVSQSASPERSAFFRQLTESWQRLAYGHRVVSVASVASLCSEWSRLFDVADAADETSDETSPPGDLPHSGASRG